ncbi:MAG TPA: hypothetical protein PKA63_05385 [Oligoflexia bacterium]|nr:hypothetical protein [Oligoflexia bacterium]HMP48081.1 hypothetical protein [Oligoflexia bacterium]
MLKSLIQFSTLFVLLTGVLNTEVFACRCQPKGSLNDQVSRHDVVFLGQVTEVRSAGGLRPGFKLVRFMPIKRYKGVDLLPNHESITIFTPEDPANCGINFSKRIDYIVFAKGPPAFLQTSSCSMTNIQENMNLEQLELEKLIKKLN